MSAELAMAVHVAIGFAAGYLMAWSNRRHRNDD
jgi:hypothetical protein